MKRLLFAALLAILCGMIYANTRPLPQIVDTPEPLHLKQDDVEIPIPPECLGVVHPTWCPVIGSGFSIAPAGWDKPQTTFADLRSDIQESDRYDYTEELDSPVSLSVSSSSAASKASRPPFIPHYKVWKTQPVSSSASSSTSVSSYTASAGSSTSKPLFCSRTGTGSRAQAKKNYCNSLK